MGGPLLHLNPLCYKLNRTRYRGVYRSSGRYVVPYIDTLGAERLRDFESLTDARNFRAACRITERLGDRSQPNLGRGSEYGGGVVVVVVVVGDSRAVERSLKELQLAANCRTCENRS